MKIKMVLEYSLQPWLQRIFSFVLVDGFDKKPANEEHDISLPFTLHFGSLEIHAPAFFEESFSEDVVALRFEGLVQELYLATSLQRPHVLLEQLPFVPRLSLRSKKFGLWIHLGQQVLDDGNDLRNI